MARPLSAPHDDDPAVESEELATAGPANGSLTRWASLHAPWWAVSVVFHTLTIVLLSLITMSIGSLAASSAMVVTTKFEKFPPADGKLQSDSKLVANSERPAPATDEQSLLASDMVVPKHILDLAELGTHFVTINPDRPDMDTAFGVEEAGMFHSIHGSDDAAGGGGKGGSSLEELIGIGSSNSPGTGEGWGGGDGTGTGVNKGSGHGSYGTRKGGGRRLMVMRHGGNGTPPKVDAALQWLAKHQEADGHWDTVKYGGKQADVACTGLALLAFLGQGHTEKVGPYRDNIQRAVYWLISIQNADGSYYKQGETHGIGYHHAIAGLAMVEAAGMSKVHDTLKSAQKGVDYSVDKHQCGEGSDRLGWRYNAKQEGDLSVTGWFIMQLKSAKVAGLKVDPAAFQGAIKFLDRVEQKGAAGDSYGGNIYGYKDPASAGHRRTAIGCLGRQFLGWKRTELEGGVTWFMDKGGVPEWGANGGSVDLYYWYYGALCAFQQDAPHGPLWTRWNTAMKKALGENQRKGGDDDGSWDPVGAYSEYWGRVGQTALGALCLEVYYRYNLMCK